MRLRRRGRGLAFGRGSGLAAARHQYPGEDPTPSPHRAIIPRSKPRTSRSVFMKAAIRLSNRSADRLISWRWLGSRRLIDIHPTLSLTPPGGFRPFVLEVGEVPGLARIPHPAPASDRGTWNDHRYESLDGRRLDYRSRCLSDTHRCRR